jgi:hypothetical protein
MKQKLTTTLGTNLKKPIIINNVRVPLTQVDINGLLLKKTHMFKELNMTKPINCQDRKKMEKVKDTLEKQL